MKQVSALTNNKVEKLICDFPRWIGASYQTFKQHILI